MPYYLAPYIGAGTHEDPFRPRGAEQVGWSAIDLRPDASLQDGGGFGFALLHLPNHDPDTQLDRLADDKVEGVAGGALARLRNRTGISDLDGTRLDEMIARLLTRPPVGAWKRIVGNRRGLYEIWLGGLLWEGPVTEAVTDDFTRPDELPIDLPWVKSAGSVNNMDLVSSALSMDGVTGQDGFWHYSGAVATADQYSQFTAVTQPDNNDWGPACRIESTQLEGYWLSCYNGSGGPHYNKFVDNGFSQLADAGGADTIFQNGDTARLEVEGSTLRGFRNGAAMPVASTTDSSLTVAAEGVGIFWFGLNGAIDDFDGGDLTGEPPPDTEPHIIHHKSGGRW